MSENNLDLIVEVQTVTAPNANKFLNAGYVLLGIYPMSTTRADAQGNSYVQQGVTFIVGRDEATKHYDVARNNGG